MPMHASAPARTQNPQSILEEYLRQLEQHRRERRALHVKLSGLLPFNRRDHHVRTAAGLFDQLIATLQGQLFVLGNGDLLFIYKQDCHAAVESVVKRIRFMFNDDPLTSEQEGRPQFVTWFDVSGAYEDFLGFVRKLLDAPAVLSPTSPASLPPPMTPVRRRSRAVSLSPAILARIETGLMGVDLTNAIRQRVVCALTEKLSPEPWFNELDISLTELVSTLVPDLDLEGNPLLFRRLTETTDRLILALLAKPSFDVEPIDISVNLNVSTVVSDAFLEFRQRASAKRLAQLIIEFDCTDVFTHLSTFLSAQEILQSQGYRVCLDAVSPKALAMIDVARLGVDLVKVFWEYELGEGDPAMQRALRAVVAAIGPSKVILSRVDSFDGIAFGQAIGIALYQGRYIDQLRSEDKLRRQVSRLKTPPRKGT